MNLSAELFAEMTVTLTGGAVPVPRPGGSERRRACRVELEKANVSLTLITDGRAQPRQFVRVRDFSPRGINVLYPSSLPAGQQIRVHTNSNDGPAGPILPTVAPTKPAQGKLFSVGPRL